MDVQNSYDPAKTAREVLAVLRKHNTPLALVEKVFDFTRVFVQQETILTNPPEDSKQP